MPTVKEQFEQIINPQLKELCLKNVNPKWENNDAPSLYDAVLSGIEWEKADGGFDFWKYVISMIKKDKVDEIDCTMEEPEEKQTTFGIMTGSKQMTPDQQAQRKARNRAKFKGDGMEALKYKDTDAFRYHLKKQGYKS